MDIDQMIKELSDRLSQLNRVIAVLEELQLAGWGGQPTYRKRAEPKRRGRKFMSAQERREVSERMKEYWSSRKASKKQRPKIKGKAD